MSSLFNRGQELVSKGNDGESAVYEYLCFIYPKTQIEDVRANPYYQHREIDFRVLEGETALTIEAKSDKHVHKGNALFELCRIHHTSPHTCAYLGWSVFTEAARVVVWNPPTRTIYDFDTAELRTGMQQYVSETRANANIHPVYTDDVRTTVNVYVPLRFVPHTRCQFVGGLWVMQDGQP